MCLGSIRWKYLLADGLSVESSSCYKVLSINTMVKSMTVSEKSRGPRENRAWCESLLKEKQPFSKSEKEQSLEKGSARLVKKKQAAYQMLQKEKDMS